MTKPRSVAATANDNSIPGSRLEDFSVPPSKLQNNIPGTLLEDFSVPPSKVEGGVPQSASEIDYEPDFLESVGRSVQDRLEEYVSVLDFGAKSGSAFDSTEAFQAAIDYCFNGNRRKTLFVPSGTYYISSPLIIDMNAQNNIRVFCIKGEMMGSAVRWGTTIVFTGTNSELFDVRLSWFPAESFRFEDIALVQLDTEPEFKTSTAIKITKTNTSYTRMHLVRYVACEGFNKFLHFNCPNGIATDNDNYFGPVLIDRCHTWANNNPIHLDNCTLNLFKIKDSLFHSATNYGILADNSPLIVSIDNTWFEGNEPAAIRNSRFTTSISLSSVGSESTGDVSGWGFLHAWDESAGQRAFVLNVSSPKGFNLMPQEFRLPRGGRVSATSPILASGRLFTVFTPETVIPIVSNNPAFSQTSTSTSYYVPLSSVPLSSRDGYRCFNSPSGDNGSSESVLIDSSTIPDVLKGVIVGCGVSETHLNSNVETFTAPESGFLYGTASLSATGNSGWNVGTQFTIDGSPIVIDQAFSVSNPKGLFVAMVPISSGSTLSQVKLTTRGTHEWSGVGDLLFSSSELAASAVSSLPVASNKEVEIADSTTFVLRSSSEYDKPYSVKVRLIFDQGSLGVYEALFYGRTLNGSKSVQVLVNSIDPSISVSSSDGFHVNLFSISVTNNSGSAIKVLKETTFLS